MDDGVEWGQVFCRAFVDGGPSFQSKVMVHGRKTDFSTLPAPQQVSLPGHSLDNSMPVLVKRSPTSRQDKTMHCRVAKKFSKGAGHWLCSKDF